MSSNALGGNSKTNAQHGCRAHKPSTAACQGAAPQHGCCRSGASCSRRHTRCYRAWGRTPTSPPAQSCALPPPAAVGWRAPADTNIISFYQGAHHSVNATAGSVSMPHPCDHTRKHRFMMGHCQKQWTMDMCSKQGSIFSSHATELQMAHGKCNGHTSKFWMHGE